MKKSEIALLEKVRSVAAKNRSSLKIEEEDRSDAVCLVDAGLCFWSCDYDHLSCYEITG